MNRGQIGAAIGIATLAPTIFAFAGPNIIAAREDAADPKKRRYLRRSSIIGGISVVGLGIGIGLVIDDRDYYTVGAAVLAAAGMIAINEHALRHPATETEAGKAVSHVVVVDTSPVGLNY